MVLQRVGHAGGDLTHTPTDTHTHTHTHTHYHLRVASPEHLLNKRLVLKGHPGALNHTALF